MLAVLPFKASDIACFQAKRVGTSTNHSSQTDLRASKDEAIPFVTSTLNIIVHKAQLTWHFNMGLSARLPIYQSLSVGITPRQFIINRWSPTKSRASVNSEIIQ